MPTLTIGKNYMEVSSNDDHYVLSEWDIKNGRAKGYTVRVAAGIASANPNTTLVLGLGAGAILGELARLGVSTAITCVEIDSEMIQHYETFKRYFARRCDATVLHCDFMQLDCGHAFDLIYGDTPSFYEDTMTEQKHALVDRMMRHSRAGTVWILNVLEHENMQKWMRFVGDAKLRTSRPRPLYDGAHCLLKLNVV